MTSDAHPARSPECAARLRRTRAQAEPAGHRFPYSGGESRRPQHLTGGALGHLVGQSYFLGGDPWPVCPCCCPALSRETSAKGSRMAGCRSGDRPLGQVESGRSLAPKRRDVQTHCGEHPRPTPFRSRLDHGRLATASMNRDYPAARIGQSGQREAPDRQSAHLLAPAGACSASGSSPELPCSQRAEHSHRPHTSSPRNHTKFGGNVETTEAGKPTHGGGGE